MLKYAYLQVQGYAHNTKTTVAALADIPDTICFSIAHDFTSMCLSTASSPKPQSSNWEASM